MTVNIALVTREAVILGCDSLSSVVEHAVFPMRAQLIFAKDKDGNHIVDANGKPTLDLDAMFQTEPVVTAVVGGARKMFPLYDGHETHVAAVTAGMAIMCGETIADGARRFFESNHETVFNSVQEVAEAFLAFMRARWEKEVNYSNVDEAMRQYLGDLQFLVGGVGKDQVIGEVYRLEIKAGTCRPQFTGGRCGLAWGGQADAVERLVQGMDATMKFTVNREIVKALADQRQAVMDAFAGALAAAGVTLPEGFELNLEEIVGPSVPWDEGGVSIDYANLSMQYAVDLVSLLVNCQSGIQRFAHGIATVGGRTHIGIVKRGSSLNMLNEAEISHSHTGYGDG